MLISTEVVWNDFCMQIISNGIQVYNSLHCYDLEIKHSILLLTTTIKVYLNREKINKPIVGLIMIVNIKCIEWLVAGNIYCCENVPHWMVCLSKML